MAQERMIALKALLRMERQKSYSNLVLASLPPGGPGKPGSPDAGLTGQQRAFVNALVYGVTERKVTLDALCEHYARRPVGKLDDEVLCILRMGLYQLHFMDAVPDSAAVNESVKLCRAVRKASASGFVNGVLRAAAREAKPLAALLEECAGTDEAERLRVSFSASLELARLLVREHGFERAQELLSASLEPAPLFLRVNTLKTDAAALLRRFEAAGLAAQPASLPDALMLHRAGAVERLPGWEDGLFHVQDLSSQRCALVLGARPGMRVLDACAAPGGKSFTAAQCMGNEGALAACDIYPHKLELIEKGAARLGLSIVHPELHDAGEPRAQGALFDRVLCDVPCSGLGILRRKPEMKYKNPADWEGLPNLQYKILVNSAQYTNRGGRLVYSTCTVLRAENEAVVDRFLSQHGEYEPDCQPLLGGEWRRTFFPGEDGDGFFIAALRRRTV